MNYIEKLSPSRSVSRDFKEWWTTTRMMRLPRRTWSTKRMSFSRLRRATSKSWPVSTRISTSSYIRRSRSATMSTSFSHSSGKKLSSKISSRLLRQTEVCLFSSERVPARLTCVPSSLNTIQVNTKESTSYPIANTFASPCWKSTATRRSAQPMWDISMIGRTSAFWPTNNSTRRHVRSETLTL